MPREVFEAGMQPAIGDIIKPSDCEFTDRVVELLQPLPPRNIARLLLEIVRRGQNGKSGTMESPLMPICPR